MMQKDDIIVMRECNDEIFTNTRQSNQRTPAH